MDENINKRSLKIIPKENLQKKAQMAEEKSNTLLVEKKDNVNNCTIS